MKAIINQIKKDIRIRLSDAFDRNFERKAFFDKKWKQTVLLNRRGSLMMRTGGLRRSILSKEDETGIHWKSSRIDAQLHNEGGTITVTQRMKKFFWAKYYEAGKKGIEAEQWRALALKKVGDEITVEQRQFIGYHPEVSKIIEQSFRDAIPEIEKYIMNLLNPRK